MALKWTKELRISCICSMWIDIFIHFDTYLSMYDVDGPIYLCRPTYLSMWIDIFINVDRHIYPCWLTYLSMWMDIFPNVDRHVYPCGQPFIYVDGHIYPCGFGWTFLSMWTDIFIHVDGHVYPCGWTYFPCGYGHNINVIYVILLTVYYYNSSFKEVLIVQY